MRSKRMPAEEKYRFIMKCRQSGLTDHQRKVCECSSALSFGAGIPALWSTDHKAEHGKLVHTFSSGIFISSL